MTEILLKVALVHILDISCLFQYDNIHKYTTCPILILIWYLFLIIYFICPFNDVLIWTLSLCNLCNIVLENKVIINNKLLLSKVEIFTYNLFVTFLTSKDISRIITTRSLIDIEQNMLCNKGTWNNVFVH
jgi:hypothetical protein